MNFKEYLLSFKPHVSPVTMGEKLKGALSAGLALLLLGFTVKFLPQLNFPSLVLNSMAAAALLLFAAPHSPMSQPWPVVGGNLLAAVVGWCFTQSGLDYALAAGLSVALTIFLMHTLKCLHPPGAATLIWVLGAGLTLKPAFTDVLYIVAVNIVIMLFLAVLINNLIPGRNYPAQIRHAPPVKPGIAVKISEEDIEHAISKMDGVIDVSVEDLSEIYELASQHAEQRLKEKVK
jgi:CBS domain-containing membrane protein